MRPAPSRVEPAVLGVVALGGVIGSLGRYAVGLLLPHAAGQFPWATLLVNVSGAFAMGVLVSTVLDDPRSPRLARPFLAVGVLGGWTTFSALAVDVVQLGAAERTSQLLAYVTVTFVAGILAVGAGQALGRRVRSPA